MKNLFTKLKENGCRGEILMQVHTPIGPDNPEETPAEIAVFIMAKVLAAGNRGTCRSMRDLLRDPIFPL